MRQDPHVPGANSVCYRELRRSTALSFFSSSPYLPRPPWDFAASSQISCRIRAGDNQTHIFLPPQQQHPSLRTSYFFFFLLSSLPLFLPPLTNHDRPASHVGLAICALATPFTTRDLKLPAASSLPGREHPIVTKHFTSSFSFVRLTHQQQSPFYS
ncbi:hypothetical protein F4778DRAFT_205273 [Xylariomycetidae sp. FL2044]|nr:hypothetical protein F4778DRAFT_205273 [Xylariomycetidae sp. FL2044]